MSIFSALTKNAFERLFNTSGLKVDKDPFYSSPSSSVLRYCFNAVNDQKPAFVLLFAQTETLKRVLLSKHNSFLQICCFHSGEFSYSCSEQIKGQFISVVVPVFTPIIYSKLKGLDSLRMLKSAVECLDFIYSQLELQVTEDIGYNDFSYVQEQNRYVFTGFDKITEENGLKPAKACQTLVSRLNQKLPTQFAPQLLTPAKYLQSSVFDNPVFRTIEELNDFSKFSDPLFIKQLNATID